VKNDKKMAFLKAQGTFNSNAAKVLSNLFLNNEFFDPYDVIQTKYEMLRSVQKDKMTIEMASKLFGFSRPSFYQTQSSFDQEGLAGLLPKKRGPRSRHKLSEEIMKFINDMILETPSLKSQELVDLIKKQYDLEVNPRSVTRALDAQKTIHEEKKKELAQ
jgi:transposase